MVSLQRRRLVGFASDGARTADYASCAYRRDIHGLFPLPKLFAACEHCTGRRDMLTGRCNGNDPAEGARPMSDEAPLTPREAMEREKARLLKEAAAKQAEAAAIDRDLAEIDRLAALAANYNFIVTPASEAPAASQKNERQGLNIRASMEAWRAWCITTARIPAPPIANSSTARAYIMTASSNISLRPTVTRSWSI